MIFLVILVFMARNQTRNRFKVNLLVEDVGQGVRLEVVVDKIV